MKIRFVILLLLVVLLLAGGYVFVRLEQRGTDIIGVTTLPEKNTVIMNSASGSEFVAGSGHITLQAGERLHLEYALDAGSFDILFLAGGDSLDALQAEDPLALPDAGDGFGESGVTGSGSLDFAAESGDYTVCFTLHGAVGRAVVTAEG